MREILVAINEDYNVKIFENKDWWLELEKCTKPIFIKKIKLKKNF
jgi:hypothetical protein